MKTYHFENISNTIEDHDLDSDHCVIICAHFSYLSCNRIVPQIIHINVTVRAHKSFTVKTNKKC